MRRNDIVLVGKPDLYNFYGRIVEKIDDEHYKVVDCGRNYGVWHYSDLTLSNEYKGYGMKKCHDISEWRYQCMQKKYYNEKMVLLNYRDWETDRKSTRLNSSHSAKSRMPSSA